VLRLAAAGYRVFAGVRRDQDAHRLVADARGDVVPVRLDVTDADQVAAVAARLATEQDGAGVHGLVNNAGATLLGPWERVSLDEFRQLLEVNVVGQMAMIQALLPHLRRAGGRVVNIGSMAGRVAGPIFGPYAATKFALEGASDALRREVRGQGVHVVLVEPGAIATPIWGKASLKLDPTGPDDVYGDLLAGVRHGIVERSAQHGMSPDAVAGVVLHALTVSRPRTRYLVGRDARARVRLAWLLPDRFVDTTLVGVISRVGRAQRSGRTAR
jgi:NAD(P)-dependent dehydrogenase (short-subunit alcohol dehydrogenase family)